MTTEWREAYDMLVLDLHVALEDRDASQLLSILVSSEAVLELHPADKLPMIDPWRDGVQRVAHDIRSTLSAPKGTSEERWDALGRISAAAATYRSLMGDRVDGVTPAKATA